MENYMMISAVIITVMNVGTLFFFKERPTIPPSASALKDTNLNYSMKKDIL